jgi:cytosine/adenosine deaminase-related metal-dependent hydrolase
MSRILIKVGTIVTMDGTRRILHGGGVVVSDSVVEAVLPDNDVNATPTRVDEIVDASSLTLIPGFVQTHIHLCQTLFRGLADDLELMDWLRRKMFPLEAAHTASSIRASAVLGLAELVRSGTTTIMDMGSVHHEEEIVRAIDEIGFRAFVGKSLIDVNTMYPPLRESTDDALADAARQCEQWHGAADGRIRYAVAPRFALSCTDTLLRGAHEISRSFPGALFHTHAAENRREMQAIRARCRMENVQFFESLGILGETTCLAHCVWVSDREVTLMADRRVKVLHCPSSNLKLGSGVARIPQFLKRGISVSLGADGAPCNNTLSPFQEMRLAALLQKSSYGPSAMDARTVFEMATRGGADALGLLDETGSIEVGKKADLVLLDLARPWNPLITGHERDLYSAVVYTASPENVDSVMVNGRWLYRKGMFTGIDEEAVVRAATGELRSLLARVRL